MAMTIGTTTGTQRGSRKEGFAVGVLEVDMPNLGVAVAGAATLNQGAGFITSEALVTAINATYTLTLTNSFIDANTMIFVDAALGTSTQGTPDPTVVNNGAGSATINVQNIGAAAFNGTIKIGFFLVRKSAAPL
jgi:hypothetical protein